MDSVFDGCGTPTYINVVAATFSTHTSLWLQPVFVPHGEKLTLDLSNLFLFWLTHPGDPDVMLENLFSTTLNATISPRRQRAA